MPTISNVLRIGPKIVALPVVHGSGDCALEVRRILLEHHFDCLAVPLPPSFQTHVEEAIQHLPQPGVVIQRESPGFAPDWSDRESDIDRDDD